jgi:hypothetical protein
MTDADDVWSRFEQAVLDDPDRQADLDVCTTIDAFTTRALEVADELAIPLTAADVEAALRRGDRRWIEHGL